MSKFYPPIKLPRSMTYFKSLNKKVSPYEKFYFWAATQLKKRSTEIAKLLFPEMEGKTKRDILKNFNVMDFWITKEDYKKLEKQTEVWIKKFYLKYGGKKMLTKYVISHSFEMGPASFDFTHNPSELESQDIKKGYLYVRQPSHRGNNNE